MSTEPGRIAWDGDPNSDRDYPRIVRPAPGLEIRCVVLSEKADLVLVHWYEGRTIPHLVPASACAGCQAHTRFRLVAYLAVWVLGNRDWSIVEVPEEAVKVNQHALAGRRGSLRGLRLTLTRIGPQPNGRVDVSWEPATQPADELPPAPSLRPLLAKLWSANNRKEGGSATT